SEFKKLAKNGITPPEQHNGHQDGYGILLWVSKTNNWIELDRSIKSAYNATINFNFPNDNAFKIVLFHMRLASPFIGNVCLENTHPFTRSDSKWIFMHNGGIRDWKKFPPSSFTSISNGSDSETMYRYILDQIRNNNESSIKDIVFRSYKYIKNNFDYTSLTSVLSNGKDSFIFRNFTSNGNYYTFYMLQNENFVVIASEPIEIFGDNRKWELIPNNTMFHLNNTIHLEKIHL
ncbi:MAG: class II glutamine amidotransferase, partial [Candidatus Thorarchaeota archaeon]